MGKKKDFPSYEEAKKIVAENSICNIGEYRTKYNSLGLPSSPNRVYKDKGWINWIVFFEKDSKFPSYEEAKKIVARKEKSIWNSQEIDFASLASLH